MGVLCNLKTVIRAMRALEASFSQWGAIQIQLPLPFIKHTKLRAKTNAYIVDDANQIYFSLFIMSRYFLSQTSFMPLLTWFRIHCICKFR